MVADILTVVVVAGGLLALAAVAAAVGIYLES